MIYSKVVGGSLYLKFLKNESEKNDIRNNAICTYKDLDSDY